MKQVKVTLTYVADVDDDLEVDYIHEKLEDYIYPEIPMNICDFEGDNLWYVYMTLQKIRTSIGKNILVTVQKTED